MADEKTAVKQLKENKEPSKFFNSPRREAVSRFLVTAAATIVVIAGIKAASGLIAPILLALFLTIILLVPLRWLRKKGCPNILALLIVLGGTVLIFLSIGYFVGTSFNDFARRIPSYKNRIVKKVEDLDKKLAHYGFAITDLTESLTGKKKLMPFTEDAQTDETDNHPKGTAVDEGKNIETDSNKDDEEDKSVPIEDELISDEELQNFLAHHQQQSPPSLISLDTKNIMYWISWSVGQLRHWAEGGFLVMIFTIFMILEAARFPEKIDRAFGKEGPIGFAHFHHIAEEIRRYLFLKAISSMMSAAAATFVYWMFGVPGTLFWGIIAFFLYFIPNIGGTLAAIIPGLLIFMTYDIEGVLLYAVCLVAIECAIAYGIEPKMLGHGLGLSVVVILLSLFTWGWILGPVGLFLSAPLTIMVKIVLQAFKETEWIAILLSDKIRDNPSTVNS